MQHTVTISSNDMNNNLKKLCHTEGNVATIRTTLKLESINRFQSIEMWC